MSNLKTNLPAAIAAVKEAENFLTELHRNGESYHPEDDANDCLAHLVTPEEGEKLNKLMEDIYNLPGNDGKHDNSIIFCPCKFILDLEN